VKVFGRYRDAPLRSFHAFDPSFTGGVHVAGGDVNGDGFDDILAAAGAGGGSHVRVFSGLDGRELMSFRAYPLLNGPIDVASGDVDGDGRADIITAAGSGGGPHVKVFSGASGEEITSFFAFDPSFTGGVSVAAGDVDGDGRDEIIAGAGAGALPEVRVFRSDGEWLSGFLAYGASFTGGVAVAASDGNGDGRAEIITGAGPGGGPHVKVFSGLGGEDSNELFALHAFDPSFTGGVMVG
jgi:serralysin